MEREKQNEIEKQRASVLEYFIDPKNPEMGYEKFGEILLKAALGTSNSAEHQKIDIEMSKLMGEIKSARTFDATYIGHMLSEASIPAMIAHIEAIRLGSNTVAPEVSKMETMLEPEGLRFLMDIVGYDDKEASGTFTSGGSMAAFTALAVARKKVQEKFESKKGIITSLFPDRDKTPKKLYVFSTPMAHYCLDKAIDYLGGQNRGIQKVIVDTEGLKMSPKDLERKVLSLVKTGAIMAIYAIAGETETGLVDPLGPIANIAERYGIFTIADAAYGAPYKESRKGQLFKDLNRYDAIIIDGHKALYTPYPNGAVLFKHAGDHALFGLGVKASYIQMVEMKDRKEEAEQFRRTLLYKGFDENKKEVDLTIKRSAEEDPEGQIVSFDLGKKRPEGSGSAGSILSTVATKRNLGKEGLRVVYDITLDNIDHLYERLEASRYLKAFHKPDVNVLCFTLSKETETALSFPKDEYERNEERKALLDHIRKELNKNVSGRLIEGSSGFFFSSTDLSTDIRDEAATKKNKEETRKKHYVLRAVLMNPRTSNEILDEAVEKMERIIEQKIIEFKNKQI